MTKIDSECRRDDDRDEATGRRYPPTWIGWAARILSLGVIGLIVALLLAEMARPERAMSLAVAPDWDAVRTVDGAVMVPVSVTNRGSGPVQDLSFELDGGFAEPVELEAALMGAGETIEYVVAFPARPASLDHRVLRYETP